MKKKKGCKDAEETIPEDEFLERWLEDLRTCGKIIIVEGSKDKKALTAFGIKNIITLRRPLYLVCEEVAYKATDAVILTDLDKKGKELYGKLNTTLQTLGVRVDHRFREDLFKNTELHQIEGLVRYCQHRIDDLK